MEEDTKSIVFLSLDAHGHVNAMLGLADALKKLKFRTIFVCNDNEVPKYFGHDLVLVRKWINKRNQGLPDIRIEDVDDDKKQELERQQQQVVVTNEESIFNGNEQLNSKWSQMVDMLDLNVSNPDKIVESLTHNYKLLKLTIEHEIIPLDEMVEDILCHLKPSLVVVDTLCPYPAIHRLSNNVDYATKERGLKSTLKWISFTSCNPMLHYNAHFNGRFPPPLMGLSTKEISKNSIAIEVEQLKYDRILKESGMIEILFKLARLAKLYDSNNIEDQKQLLSTENMEQLIRKFARNESNLMNIYMFPYKLDYCFDNKQFKLPEKLFVQIDSFVREPLNESVLYGDGNNLDTVLLDKVSEWRRQQQQLNGKSSQPVKIIYVSLGTTMSYNLKLLSQICKQVFVCLTNHSNWHFVISLGSRFRSLPKEILNQIEQWQERKRLISATWFPQPLLFERNLIDACVTHGGNNTLCELFQFKVAPRLVLIPAFHDQLDNARRVSELEMGVSIPAIKFLTLEADEEGEEEEEEAETTCRGDKNNNNNNDNGADLLLLQAALERSFELGSELSRDASANIVGTKGEEKNNEQQQQLRDSNYCARLIEAQLLSSQEQH